MSFIVGSASGHGLAQAIQVLAALCVLAGFAGAQSGVLSVRSRLYLALNLVGSTTLAGLAAVDNQYGFLLLEGVWALVSAFALLQMARAREPVPR